MSPKYKRLFVFVLGGLAAVLFAYLLAGCGSAAPTPTPVTTPITGATPTSIPANYNRLDIYDHDYCESGWHSSNDPMFEGFHYKQDVSGYAQRGLGHEKWDIIIYLYSIQINDRMVYFKDGVPYTVNQVIGDDEVQDANAQYWIGIASPYGKLAPSVTIHVSADWSPEKNSWIYTSSCK